LGGGEVASFHPEEDEIRQIWRLIRQGRCSGFGLC
jgi:hypothetical protein